MSGVCCGSVSSRGGLDETSTLCGPVPLEATGAGLEERSSGGLCPTKGMLLLRQNLLKLVIDHLTSLCLRAGEIQLGFV